MSEEESDDSIYTMIAIYVLAEGEWLFQDK